MRATVLREFGPPAALQIERMPDPDEKAGWTTVRVHAASLNWHDVLVRQGLYRSPLPHIPGADGAGVTASGDEVMILPSLFWGADEAAPGGEWEILGDRRPGTLAELVSVPDGCLFPKPPGYSWEQAAALPLVGVTAFRALITRGALRPGESLLILGAGGGLAPMATALASGIGATVVVAGGSEDKISSAVELGAAGGVLYRENGWVQAARTLNGGGFDLVLDSVGEWEIGLEALRPGGRLVVLGASRHEHTNLQVRPFYFGQYSVLGTTMGSAEDFSGLLKLVNEGMVPPPVIDSTFALDQIVQAHQRLESGHAFGKVVVEI